MTPYPTLLSPAHLGPVEVRNRVVSTSHQTGLVHDHLPTDDMLAYHRARAAGGTGAIFIEAAAVHPSGLLTAHTLGGYLPAIVAGYERLSAAVHEHGTKLFVQLFHGGREQISAPPRPPALAPSAIPSARFKSEPRALTLSEIGELIDGYRTAARLAREGGLDGLELSLAHGYLAAQFFAPRSNTRRDDYNGDLTARLRFAQEIVAAAREGAGPDMAVGVRLAAHEMSADGLDAAACAEITAALCAELPLDFVSFALGNSAGYAGSVWIAPPPPAAANAIGDHLAQARAAAAGTPTIATTRIVDPSDAEAVLASGATDLVGMTRALIADPRLVAKAAGEDAEPVNECIGCNAACIGHYHAGVPIGCVVEVRTGREGRMRAPRRGRPPRRVLVIGGGPAGAAAGIEAARWGAEVEVREREAELGGQIRLAAAAPAHEELWARWRRSTEAKLRHLGVRVELSHEVRADADLDGFDDIVLATGARPYRPPLPSPAGVRVLSAWEAIARPDDAYGEVLVADWGGDWAGLDAAEMLRSAGHSVTVACAALHPGESLHQYQRGLYLARIDTLEIPILHHRELADADGGLALRHVFSARVTPLPRCDTLVLAHGRVPADELWSVLDGVPGAVRVGDVLGPRSLDEATLEGALAAYRAAVGDERAAEAIAAG